MFDRFRKGPIPAETHEPVFSEIEDALLDVWEGEDGNNAELIGEHHVDPWLVKMHEREKEPLTNDKP